MSHSTTGTFTYPISKYSRSYPTARTAQTNNTGPDLASEWQHFTNPIIRLVLDITTNTTTNELESVRLRVLWKMDMDQGSKDTQVIFEDLDLLALSFLPSLGPNKNHPEGLPLKAVYRDTVVGIRYLYSQEDPSSPIFRRFQMSFQSSVEASAFIDSIRPICPCKLNAVGTTQPNAALKSMMTMNPPPNRAPTLNPPVTHSINDSSDIRRTATINSGLLAGTNLSALQHPTMTSLSISSSPLRQQSLSSPVPLNIPSGNVENVVPSNGMHSFHWRSSAQGLHINTANPVVLPPSSLPTASDPDARQDALPIVSATAKPPVLAALSEYSSVYDLPPSVLENVVAEVIREDGFLELMEKLSDIIRIKEWVNRSRTTA